MKLDLFSYLMLSILVGFDCLCFFQFGFFVGISVLAIIFISLLVSWGGGRIRGQENPYADRGKNEEGWW